jgi:hypothetical protein
MAHRPQAWILAVLSLVASTCRSTTADGNGAAPDSSLVDHDQLARPMFEDGLSHARELLLAGQGTEARKLAEQLIAQEPPADLRPRFEDVVREGRKLEVASAHKLLLRVQGRERELCFGEVPVLDITLENVGDHRLDVPAETTSFFISLGMETPERSQVRLSWRETSFDVLGCQWSESGSEDRLLPQDVSLAPHESFTWTWAAPLSTRGRAIYRVIELDAVLRPLAVMSESGSVHYYPIRSEVERVVVWPEERWRSHRISAAESESMLGQNDAELAFLALVATEVSERKAAIGSALQMMSRLNELSRRSALSAVRHLTGRELGLDVERWRAWWETDGRYRDYPWGSD